MVIHKIKEPNNQNILKVKNVDCTDLTLQKRQVNCRKFAGTDTGCFVLWS